MTHMCRLSLSDFSLYELHAGWKRVKIGQHLLTVFTYLFVWSVELYLGPWNWNEG